MTRLILNRREVQFKPTMPHPDLPEGAEEYIRELYQCPFNVSPIPYRPWHTIHEDAVVACSIIAPTLKGKDTVIHKITVSQKGVTVSYSYMPYPGAEGLKKTVAGFRFEELHDPLLWQYLLRRKYPVPLFIELGHPLNGENVSSLGIGVEQL